MFENSPYAGLSCWQYCHFILYMQLRGLSGKRQVPGAEVGLQHNFGIGGAAVVTLYKKYKPGPSGRYMYVSSKL